MLMGLYIGKYSSSANGRQEGWDDLDSIHVLI